MKKQTISTLVIIGAVCIMQSCATFTPCTTLNAYLAPSMSNITGESTSWMYTFGGQAGVDANIPFKGCKLPLTAWAGLNLSAQGAAWEENFAGETYSGRTRLWYLYMPLTGKYTLTNGLFFGAGIQPGILLSAKDKEDGDSFDYRDYIKTFDMGIPLELGYNFANNFGVAFKFTPGVTNVNKGEYDTYKDHNMHFALKILYSIPGKNAN
jgi:hypothetical protein